jgi:hypothetical protein
MEPGILQWKPHHRSEVSRTSALAQIYLSSILFSLHVSVLTQNCFFVWSPQSWLHFPIAQFTFAPGKTPARRSEVAGADARLRRHRPASSFSTTCCFWPELSRQTEESRILSSQPTHTTNRTENPRRPEAIPHLVTRRDCSQVDTNDF